MQDLNRIAALPGQKIILRGNHDYWWTSLKKMQQATEGKFMFLQNNFFACGDVAVAVRAAGFAVVGSVYG